MPISAEIISSEDFPSYPFFFVFFWGGGLGNVEHIAVFHSEFIASARYQHYALFYI